MDKDESKFVIIIVNSIPPYCYELNNILSLPDGFNYRFRYQKKKMGEWMPEIENPKDLMKCTFCPGFTSMFSFCSFSEFLIIFASL